MSSCFSARSPIIQRPVQLFRLDPAKLKSTNSAIIDIGSKAVHHVSFNHPSQVSDTNPLRRGVLTDVAFPDGPTSHST